MTLSIPEFEEMWLFTNLIYYLGQFIKAESLEASLNTSNNIWGLQVPSYITKFRAFPGLWSVFWWFVPNFSRNAANLNGKLEKDQPSIYELSDENALPIAITTAEAYFATRAGPSTIIGHLKGVHQLWQTKHLACFYPEATGWTRETHCLLLINANRSRTYVC